MTEEPKMTNLDVVGEFILHFEASLDPRLWAKLCIEEAAEIMAEEIGTPEYLKEVCDGIYVDSGLALTCNEFTGQLLPKGEVNAISDALGVIDKAKASAIEHYGQNVLAEAFLAVHTSNMSKLDDNGKPIRREDGKIIKGPNYKAPDIKAIIEAAKYGN